MRLITTVPDPAYFAQVGFDVTLPSHGDTVVSVDDPFSEPLYDSIIASGATVTLADFIQMGHIEGGDSAKIALETLTGIPERYFADDNPYRFKVVPYLITKDGRRVEGPVKIFRGYINANGLRAFTSQGCN